MQAYKFSLEKILEWRKKKEKAEVEKLALVQKELHKEEESLEKLTNEHDAAKDKILSYRNIQKIQQQRLYINTLEEKKLAKELLIQELEEKLEKVRQALLLAQRDKKVIERLKEKDFEAYRDSMASLMQKELDEAAILRYK